MTAKIALGFELVTGKPISVPPDRHAICVGLTQQSGKSTTLEAMANKISGRAVAFITKPGERAFESGEQIPPFFLEPQVSDEMPMWRFVTALIEARLNEDIEGEKKRIMTVCRGARSLKQVYANAQKEFAATRTGHTYIAIIEYLEMVLPEIERIGATKKLNLHKGLNVMDLRSLSDGMKNLVIASVLRYIHQHEKNVIVIIPEAWKIVPAGRNSPVLLAAVPLIREGAANGNYFWLDAQDLASVHIEMRRSVSLFLIGRQTQPLEIERGIASLIPEPARPEPSELMSLRIGDFFVGYDNFRARVYIQPLWADSFASQNYATSKAAMPQAPQRPPSRPVPEPVPTQPERTEGDKLAELEGKLARLQSDYDALFKLAEDFKNKNQVLLTQLAQRSPDAAAVPLDPKKTENGVHVPVDHGKNPKCLFCQSGSERVPSSVVPGGFVHFVDDGRRECRDHSTTPPSPEFTKSPVMVKTKANGEVWEGVDIDALIERLCVRAAQRPEILQVFVSRPELQVVTERKILKIEGDTTSGRLARLIHDGFFESAKNGDQAHKECLRRGWRITQNGRFHDALRDIAEMGFLTVETGSGRSRLYQAVPGMIVEKAEA